jgi:hypothetical protein
MKLVLVPDRGRIRMHKEVSSVEDLRKSLAQFPDEMKVEVAPKLGMSARTVRDLRALSSIPCKLRLRRPSRLPYLQIPLTVEALEESK